MERTATAPSFSPADLAPLGAVMIWSGNTIVTKAASGLIDPGSITFYRWGIAWLVLTPFLGRAAWAARAELRPHLPRLALLGALGMAAYQGIAYKAAQTTSAVNMSVIVALMPLLSALLANTLAGERLTLLRLAGTLLSFAGLLFITTHGQPQSLLHGAVNTGDLLMLIAVASNALYGVLLRRWALPIATWRQLYVQIGFGTLLLLPLWLCGPRAALTTGNLPLVLYAAIPASLGAPFCWMTGVKRLGAARAAQFMNLLPPLVALLAWLLLGEKLHAYHAVGGLMALAGVSLALRTRAA